MAKGPDDLVEFVLAEIALCGVQGVYLFSRCPLACRRRYCGLIFSCLVSVPCPALLQSDVALTSKFWERAFTFCQALSHCAHVRNLPVPFTSFCMADTRKSQERVVQTSDALSKTSSTKIVLHSTPLLRQKLLAASTGDTTKRSGVGL